MHATEYCITSLKNLYKIKIKKFLIFLFFTTCIYGDSFNYNSFNNHGVVGLVNMPTARFFNESVYGITLHHSSPFNKITLTSAPYDWMEASFFYTNINKVPYCLFSYDKVCSQDYKDKGFNFKIRIKEEGVYPSIAIGINDIAGTGLFSSEYIVASYGIEKFDFHFGVGWGAMSGNSLDFNNPLGYINNQFKTRPSVTADRGGQFALKKYFSGQNAAPFFGVAYSYNEKLLLKLELDSTNIDYGKIPYENPKNDFSFGIDYKLNSNFSIGLGFERGNHASLNLIYKVDSISDRNKFKYKKAKYDKNDQRYKKFIKNLENNGIGVSKIYENSQKIGLEITQFIHPNLNTIEEIIHMASIDSGISKKIEKDLRTANLQVSSDYDENSFSDLNLIYERRNTKKFFTDTNIVFRPFLASREEFFKGAILLENNSEFILRDNLFFNTNIKYSLADNFDDLIYPPATTFPAQVRSDVKDYLKNQHKEGILIGRAQLDYYLTPKMNHHLMITAGILEDMFSGYGFEYLYFKGNTNYAVGFELFDVKKRDYEWSFGTLDYANVSGSLNFYYRNYGSIPFDMKISYGEYLAGDVGSTIEFSRSFENGTKFGVFASFTDVTTDQFGEGSFDKGIFFNIPVYGNFINYSWRPLTKDPGAKLNRRNNLHDLLVKFRPIN